MTETLPGWREGTARKAIIDFVARVCREDSQEFVQQAERIAVFDNDGALWSEQPFYFQGLFLFERLRELADRHPEWKTSQPFQSALEGDWQTFKSFGSKGLLDLAVVVLSGTTTDEYECIVRDWLATARHPMSGRLYTEMVFQPMLELLEYLRGNGFKTFIVSGGGIEFVRAFSERVYGVPPEQVVGSSIVTRYQVRDGEPVLERLPELNFIDDGEGKPVGIHQHIGRRPIAAFGNSDGDLQMLEWTTGGEGARFGLLLHHDDAEREFAYDRHSAAGRLDRALTEAPGRGWTVVSMKNDWKTVYP
ncbi:haloacid dehalogenase-like hydrolase [bacterium]|nr:haloacid dehalogenase-like hydrolase [bacterium]